MLHFEVGFELPTCRLLVSLVVLDVADYLDNSGRSGSSSSSKKKRLYWLSYYFEGLRLNMILLEHRWRRQHRHQ